MTLYQKLDHLMILLIQYCASVEWGQISKRLSQTAIESLRVQHREINRDKEKRQGRYNTVVSQLKSNISTTISSARKIDLEEVFEFEEEVSDFVNEWEDELENFSEIFHSQTHEYSDELGTIERLLKLRDVCIQIPETVVSFSDNFGDNAESLGSAIEFIYS